MKRILILLLLFVVACQRPIGGDRDEHGCLIAAGYSWCEASQECIRPFEQNCEPVIGGDQDEFGCLVAAGYSWDSDIGACTRDWELDANERVAARMAVAVQSFRPITVVSVEQGDCDLCYVVRIQGQGEPFDMEIDLTRLADSIASFDDCTDAGFPVMESYPRQCNAFGENYVEAIEHICTEEEQGAVACTMDYNPVCGKFILNTGEATYQTFGNGCSACAGMKVVSYVPGACEDKLFVVCRDTVTGFDPVEFAADVGGICVERCPEGFDEFMTQIGVGECIQHYGSEEISSWEICTKSSESCNCVRAYETTQGEEISDAEYRCVPSLYADRMLFRGGQDRLDEDGEQSVVIA